MERLDLILAAMSPAGNDSFSPVQVQKLFFLLDMNIAKQTAGPHFNFEPYDYGPFDKQVYLELKKLRDDGLVEIFDANRYGTVTYQLTNKGHRIGEEALRKLPGSVQKYIGEVVKFIRSLPFAELVSAIYKAYPAMKVNSVFVQTSS